jgi:serine/threonine-protein kinase
LNRAPNPGSRPIVRNNQGRRSSAKEEVVIRDNQAAASKGKTPHTANGSPAPAPASASGASAPAASHNQSASQLNPPPSWMGKRVGRFRLTGLLGQGAMGRVFRAEDTMLRRQVALKVLPKTIKRGQRTVEAEKLIREARAVASLEHPNIVQVYEVNEAGGVYYIAMELVEAGSLRDLVEGQGPIDYLRVCQLGAESAEALGHAHAAGIVHRDVKPANLLLTRTGRVKVADFGLARVEDPSDLTNFLAESVGTPQFVAPEILQGQPATGKSDMYSLGATLWYLLTGKPPFEAARAEELLHKHLNAPLPSLKKLRPDLPDALVRTINTSLAKDPAKRHGTAGQFAAALRVHSIPVGAEASMAGASSQSLSHLAKLAAQAERSSGQAPEPQAQPQAAKFGGMGKWVVPVASLGGVAVAAAIVVGVIMFRGGAPSVTKADVPKLTATKRPAANRPAPVPAAPVEEPATEAPTDGDAQKAAASAAPAPASVSPDFIPNDAPAASPAPDAAGKGKSAAAAARRHDKIVDLMPMIDPAVATVAGSWRFENGDLVSDSGKPATLQIPYSPPAEYDFRIEFTAQSTVQQHLFKDPASFSWAMGDNHDCGFEYVGGKHVWESPFKAGLRITPGKRHVSLVRVRNNRVQGYIDGQLLVDAVTDFKDFSKNPELAQPDNSRLGLGTYNAPARFHKVEVIEITPK